MKKELSILAAFLFLSGSLAASAEEAKSTGFSFFKPRASKAKKTLVDLTKETPAETGDADLSEEEKKILADISKLPVNSEGAGETKKKEPVILPASAAIAAPRAPMTVFKAPYTGAPKNPNSGIPKIPQPPRPPSVPNTSGPEAPPKAPNTKQ